MPIEIKEMIVKVNIQEKNDRNNTSTPLDKKTLAQLKKEIINECMEKVDEYFERLSER